MSGLPERDGLRAHVVVEPLDLGAERVGEGVFDAATRDPAGMRGRRGRLVADEREREARVDHLFAVHHAAGAVDQRAIPDREAEATAHRAEPVDVLRRVRVPIAEANAGTQQGSASVFEPLMCATWMSASTPHTNMPIW